MPHRKGAICQNWPLDEGHPKQITAAEPEYCCSQSTLFLAPMMPCKIMG